MRINKFAKNIIITSMVFGAMVLNGTTSSKAVLQSNSNDGATYNLNDWMVNVRKMEELGGAMGLSETLNSNLTSSSDSNGIDVHMQKNTEYGALAILSASSYGNPNKINDGETTTGNVTGVVMKFNYEWVAAGTVNEATNYVNAVGRYKNIYYESYSKRNGDAITETYGWHGSRNNAWISGAWPEMYAGLIRNRGTSIFDYYGYGGGANYGFKPSEAYWANSYHSRAVIVQGEGI